MKSLLPQFWYVLAESHEVTSHSVLARQVLDEWLACYRDEGGKVVVARDRCIHRCAKLSAGSVKEGKLSCRYHGWVYGSEGKVVSIPVEGGEQAANNRKVRAKTYKVVEQEGYVYVCLEPGIHTPPHPTALSDIAMTLRGNVRLQHKFNNSLANCVENYIDVPHTAYVHHGVFRKPKGEMLRTTVSRNQGAVHITYHGERVNLGSFSFFLNPKGEEIEHSDHFYAPNITSVHYLLPCGYRYCITSQSIPVTEMETMVYTDISYDFGIWTDLARLMVARQARIVIAQDIDILDEQGRNIEKYGEKFFPTSADTIHTLTSEIIDGLREGTLPCELPAVQQEVCFCV